ncbi:MAG: hypothetical protein WCX81_06855 [Monoglobales bacterium]
MKNKSPFLALFLVVLLSLSACRSLDVIGNKSITSFDEVLKAMPSNVSADETSGGWAITSPGGAAKFIWSKDFSQSADFDVMIEFDSKPFIDAGLDLARLPIKNVSGDKIIIGTNLGDESISYDAEATPLSSYEKIVEFYRESIQYHDAMDHFGVSLADGNVFEWAKDMSANDKDFVFALNPRFFIDAGADPSKIEGWVFAKVETMDKNGKMIEEYKLLKPFNIK